MKARNYIKNDCDQATGKEYSENFRTAPYFIMHAHIHLRSDAFLRGHSMCWNEPATGPLGEKISAFLFKLYF